jgi:Cellulose synthase operon protein C C-terminus (BCSC_C)
MMRRVVMALALVAAAAALARGQQQPATPGESDEPRPVTPEEIARLRREIEHETRSSVELLFDGHGEDGDVNNELSFLRYGARLNLRRASGTTFHLSVRQTPYSMQDDVIQESGLSFALGARSKRSERVEYEWELGGTRFSNDAWSVTGLVSVTVQANDEVRYTIGARRSNVEESMLSAAGLLPIEGPFAGDRVGSVTDNRATFGASWQLPAQFDVVGEAALGARTGSHVGTNAFGRAGGGPGWNAVARSPESPLSLLRLGAWLEYFAFADDRLGYGGVSLIDSQGRPVSPEALGSDGISPEPSPTNPGVGGYFSPSSFFGALLRLEMRGRPSATVEYSLSGSLGTQSFTGSDRSRAAGIAASLTLNRGGRVSLPLAFHWDDYGPFTQYLFQARLVLLF